MPFYDYYCPACEHEQEVMHGINEEPEIKCEKCNAVMKRIIKSGHGGFVMASGGTRRRDYATRYGGKTKKSSSSMTPAESADAKARAQIEDKKNASSSDPYASFR